MSKLANAEGECLCGATRIKVKEMDTRIGACHCGMCRTWSGGPYLGLDCGTDVSFDGSHNISVYSSSEWAERGFCSVCGTHLFYKFNHNSQYIMPVALFDDEAGLQFDHQIFIDKKPDYYDFANHTEKLTEAEVIAQFAPPA